MKIFVSVFVLFVVIVAVTSQSDDSTLDIDIEQEKILKDFENCIREWYVGRDWEKVLSAGNLVPGAQYCIVSRTGLMEKYTNKLNTEKLKIFITDEPRGFKDGKSVDQVREEIGRICSTEYNSYYGMTSAGMILNCLGREMKERRLDPYTIINPKDCIA